MMQRKGQRRGGGFTVLEIVLVLAILGLLAGAVVVNYRGLFARARLDEAAARFKSLLRASRAEAQLSGLRMRLRFDAEGEPIVVEYEPEPLTAPGRFERFTEADWVGRYFDGAVLRVVACELTDAGARAAAEFEHPRDLSPDASGEPPPVLHPLVFEPSGESASARIELAAADPGSDYRVVIELDGYSGDALTEKTRAQPQEDAPPQPQEDAPPQPAERPAQGAPPIAPSPTTDDPGEPALSGLRGRALHAAP